MVTETEIARRVGLDVPSVKNILKELPGLTCRKHTIAKVFRIAERLGYDFARLRRNYHRHERIKRVAIKTDVSIYREDRSLYDQGTATISSISSLGSAVIRDLPVTALPRGRIKIVLRPLEKPLEGLDLPCRLVHFPTPFEPGYAIEFVRLKPEAKRRLQRVIGTKKEPRGKYSPQGNPS